MTYSNNAESLDIKESRDEDDDGEQSESRDGDKNEDENVVGGQKPAFLPFWE